MRLSEIFRLVLVNLFQNKSKVVLTSTGIIVGTATIMLVIAIGTGGKLEVAEQFKNLNAGAIDISYEYQGRSNRRGQSGSAGGEMPSGGGGMPDMGGFSGGGMPSGGGGMPSMPSGGGMPDMGGFSGGGMPFGGGDMPAFDFEGGMPDMGAVFGFGGRGQNTEKIILSEEEVTLLKEGSELISDATLTFTTKSDVDGGELEETTSYTIAGIKNNYADMSNFTLSIGEFITQDQDTYKERVCILGAKTAKEIFGSALDAYDETIYIDNRAYVVNGVLAEMGTVASGISPDEAIFIPYQTGVKYLTGTDVSPTLTIVAADVDEVDTVMEQAKDLLASKYPNAEFTMSDAGSKMEAASKSNETLTMLLAAMAVIVFIVGGIGIMNVLFVSVRERTNEIGILKAIGCSRKDILLEFLLEAGCISLVGAVFGVLFSLAISPVIEQLSVRVELSVFGAVLSLLFGVLTGTMFGFYPAYKASRLLPVTALNQE